MIKSDYVVHPNCWTKNLMIWVFCMTKYDYGFKKQVVIAYLNGEGGYKFISKKYGIPNKSQVKKWVNAYKTLGDDGLKLKNKHTNYPIQFKLEVINYMTTTKSSLQETANHFGINNNSIIEAWKLKFLSGGSEALSRKSGRPSMGKNKSVKKKKLTREQELEHENELLRAELAFIKKLRALGMDVPERLKMNMKQE